MTDGFSNIDCTITITDKKTKTAVVLTSDISDFKEDSVQRKVEMKEIMGGMILPRIHNPSQKKITFNYISVDNSWEKYLGHDPDAGTIDKMDFDFYWGDIDSNLYRIELKFSDGTNTLYKVYYDAIGLDIGTNIQDEILSGTISFIIPLKNISGYTTYAVFTDATKLATYDTSMGY